MYYPKLLEAFFETIQNKLEEKNLNYKYLSYAISEEVEKIKNRVS